MDILELDTPTTGVWNTYLRAGYARWEVGQTCEIHSHQEAAEIFIFLDGECRFETETGAQTVRAGQTVYVGPGERHKLTAVGDRPLVMFMAVTPNHAPTHTFYRDDGTPVHWDRPAPGSPEVGARPFGLTREDLAQR
jgi:quercetin dioxygenase-like cupin family protein